MGDPASPVLVGFSIAVTALLISYTVRMKLQPRILDVDSDAESVSSSTTAETGAQESNPQPGD